MGEPGQIALYGTDLFDNPIDRMRNGALAQEFMVPPFSVLNTREGYWQERKRAWVGLGIKSEVGRGEDGTARAYGSRDSLSALMASKRANSIPGGSAMPLDRLAGSSGVSIFDPVLTELAYRWFCPPGGQVVDPFAGGSVRGIVAHLLGYRYWGSELRPEQVLANQEQLDILGELPAPEWLCGDAMELLPDAPAADFIFTCPPYGDLERYSDDPRDLSTMEYHTFLAAYKRIILRACQRLKPHRFAAIVVGDFRDRRGYYRGFVGDTVAAFREQGLEFYNELIVLTAIGSLPVRTGKQFRASRKVGRAHQNMLVFVKGNSRIAASLCEGQEALL